MRNINEIVKLYLSMDTNYALMINGGWGTGKTYYFNTVIRREIEQINIRDSDLKYKTILVSLFGVKSLAEIQQSILLTLGRIPNGDAAKIVINISSGILEKFIGKEAVETISKANIKNIIDFKKCVLCLDDFERVSSKLTIEEVVGFVNSLTEDLGAKVILISNEKEIADQDKYKRIKEKVVGNTIEFMPDLDELYDDILKSKLQNEELKKVFLTRKVLISSLFVRNEVNLRTLLFAISYFERVFLAVRDLITKSTLEMYYDAILNDLIRFTFSISIAFKNSEINYKEKRGLHLLDRSLTDMDKRLALSTLRETQSEVNTEYGSSFMLRFYSGAKFHFYNSIYNFLTGGSILDKEILLFELKEIYHIEKGEVPAHYDIINKLGYNQYRDLSDEEYKLQTRKLVFYCEQGMYKVDEYFPFFKMITRHDNLLKYNVDLLEKRMIKGMRKAKSTYEHVPRLGMYIEMDPKDDYRENLEAIRNEILRINAEVGLKESKEIAMRLEEIFHKDSEAFYKEVLENKQYSNEPFFNNFNFRKFYSTLIHSDNKFRRSFYRFLYKRLEIMNRLPEEKEFFLRLKGLVEKKIKKTGNSITKLSYQGLLNEINKTLGPTK